MVRNRRIYLYLIVAALSVAFGQAAVRMALELVQGPSFSATEGTVVCSEWHRHAGGYFVDITYDYTVEGYHYQSDHYFGAWNRAVGQKQSREIVNRHPVGTKVVVRYDPKDPARNYIVLPKEYWRIILYGSMAFLYPLLCVLCVLCGFIRSAACKTKLSFGGREGSGKEQA